MAYQVDKLQAEFPRPEHNRPFTAAEPTLADLLRFGTQEELVAAVLDKALTGWYRDAVIRVLPMQALLVGIFDRLPLSLTHRGRIISDGVKTTYYNEDGTVKMMVSDDWPGGLPKPEDVR